MPKFSVIIPAYNAAAYIERALDSVRRQSFQDYETIVTNDGSTDETPLLLEQYGGKHPAFPLVVTHQANLRLGAARNAAMRIAKGEFLAFLDADDVWNPEKLERLSAYLERNNGVDVAYHDKTEVRDGKRRVQTSWQIRPPVYERLLFERNPLSPSATAVRRELTKRIGGFSEEARFHGAEDKDYWLRLAAAGARFGHLGEVLSEYHRVKGSLSLLVEEHRENTLNVFEHHLQELERNRGEIGTHWQRAVHRYRVQNLVSAGQGCWRNQELQRAFRFHWRALRMQPWWWKPYAGIALVMTKSIVRPLGIGVARRGDSGRKGPKPGV